MSLQEQSLNTLYFKKQLLEQIIRENKDDDRVEEPERQLRIINEEIMSRERSHDLVVGLNTLKLKSKRG
jgi:hypothetical protein